MRLLSRITQISLLAPAILLAATHIAEAQEPLHGRVSFAANDGLVRGTDDADWSYATINSLVMPGDTLWADSEAVMELEFSGGTFLRLADGSKAEVIAVPPDAQFRGWNGSFYIQRVRRGVGTTIFETPVGTITVEANTQARIDILGEGQTTVSVRWGSVSIHVDGSPPVNVTQGNRSYVDPGYFPSSPAPFDRSFEDDFDAWNRERARLLAIGTENVPIAASYDLAPVGTADLNSYGDWVYADDDYYWRPTAVSEYIPYRSGHWSYGNDYGYTWVGDYPFSYVTSHYGNWNYNDHYGWLWRYNAHYSPAYVASIRHGDYFVWSPLGYNGYPVNYGYDYYNVGGVQFSIFGSSYLDSYSLLGGHGQSVYGLTRDHYNSINSNNTYIWNINLNGSRYADTGYRGGTLPVRDYTPTRVMRGPSEVAGSARSASARVTRLENSSRTSFRTAAASNRSATSRVRTSANARSRTASPRSATVTSTARARTSTALRHAERTNVSTRQLITRRGDATRIPTFTNADARNAKPVASGNRPTRTSTRTTGTRQSSTAPSTRSVNPRATSTRSSASTNTRATTRTNAPTVRSTRTTSSVSSTRSAPTSSRPTPRTVRATVPRGSFNSVVPRTRAPQSSVSVSTSSRSQRFSNSAPTTRSTGSRGVRSAPRSAPSTSFRSAPPAASTPRTITPSRVAPRTYTAPPSSSRSINTPARGSSRIAPQTRGSGRSFSAPRSAPAPRVSAPLRSSSGRSSSFSSRSSSGSSRSSSVGSSRSSGSRSSSIGSRGRSSRSSAASSSRGSSRSSVRRR